MGVDIAKLNNLFADYYNSGEFVTNDLKNNLKKALGALFDELDNGGVKDGKLTSADGLSEEYASLFSITDSTSLTKEEFLSNIDTYVNTLGEKRAKLSENYRKEDYEQPLSTEASKNNGKMVFDMIDGPSLDDDYPIVNQYIKQLDKTTVLPFLEGYYEKQSKKQIQCEGIIEHLDDEHDSGTIEFSSKKNIITSLMALAKEEGLTKSLNYIRLENILNKPEYVDNTAKDFNRGHRFNWTGATPVFGGAIGGAVVGAITGFCTGGPVGAVIGAVVGGAVGYPALGAADQITDNEIIDKALKGLYAEIKQKQANN